MSIIAPAVRSALALAVLAAVAAGCGTAAAPSSAGSEESRVVAAESQAANALPQQGGPPVDACALLPAATVTALTGPNDGGKADPPTNQGGGTCTWTNQTNQYNVTVEVDGTGTAAGGVLPTLDPSFGPAQSLPNGMRSLGGGVVQFTAGDRLCQVQVSTLDSTGKPDQDVAAELAGTVRGKLGA